MKSQPDVVVIGAGLSGLTATRALAKAGLSVKVLEANSSLGGRVRTDLIDGFRLDNGFQLFNPAYPAARSVLNISELELKKFRKGIRVLLDDQVIEFGSNLNHSIQFIKHFEKSALLNFAKYTALTTLSKTDALAKRADVSSAKALAGAIDDEELITQFLKPFLAGVFLEAELKTSRRWLDQVLRYFVLGSPGVPKNGMQEIPNQLARGIAHLIEFETSVAEVKGGEVITNKGSWKPKYILLATDPITTAKLLDKPRPNMNSVTTWYFSIKHRNRGIKTKLLAVDGSSKPGVLTNSVVLTDAARTYAPKGYDLISSSAIGIHGDEKLGDVIAHTALLHTINPADLEFIRSYQIAAALPEFNLNVINDFTKHDAGNVFIASDLITTPSINGAMAAGQQAADQILFQQLKGV